MRTKSYYASLVTKPIIITAPGEYVTRGGETVSITKASSQNDHGCIGAYSNGTLDRWHRSGRIFFGVESENDIVRAADGASPGEGGGVAPGESPTVATAAPETQYVVVQEGGSTGEYYWAAFYSLADAEAHRHECDEAAYHTSIPVKVPADLAAHPQFHTVLHELVKAFAGMR